MASAVQAFLNLSKTRLLFGALFILHARSFS